MCIVNVDILFYDLGQTYTSLTCTKINAPYILEYWEYLPRSRPHWEKSSIGSRVTQDSATKSISNRRSKTAPRVKRFVFWTPDSFNGRCKRVRALKTFGQSLKNAITRSIFSTPDCACFIVYTTRFFGRAFLGNC